ncbi:hypothetical protein ACJX0J_015433 [Zea mays]
MKMNLRGSVIILLHALEALFRMATYGCLSILYLPGYIGNDTSVAEVAAWLCSSVMYASVDVPDDFLVEGGVILLEVEEDEFLEIQPHANFKDVDAAKNTMMNLANQFFILHELESSSILNTMAKEWFYFSGNLDFQEAGNSIFDKYATTIWCGCMSKLFFFVLDTIYILYSKMATIAVMFT